MPSNQSDSQLMARALQLAARGEGSVEPNPMVGCVVARGDQIVGEGWHQRFGGPHAEVEALDHAGAAAQGATMYVTLEPCCHHGKTPPCTRAMINAGIGRVVVAQHDPFEQVDGGGIKQLRAAGINVETGLLRRQAQDLNAPYLKLVTTGRPWIIAKWAMTLDGKIAARSGDSQWISQRASRAVVHRLRSRVDGVMVGRGTAEIDDPSLTARPPGRRTATRIVVDSCATIPLESQIVRTARDVPVLVAGSRQVPTEKQQALAGQGCELFICQAMTHAERLDELIQELGRRQMTNVLVEGGGALLGSLLDMRAIDEVHVFVAPKLIGGKEAFSIGGHGIESIASALALVSPRIEQLDGDVYVAGRIGRQE